MIAPPNGQLTREHVPDAARELERLWSDGGDLTVDMSFVEEVDSAGAALLAAFRRRAQDAGRRMSVTGLKEEVGRTLDLFPFIERPSPPRDLKGWLETLGEQGSKVGEVGLEYLLLCADVAWFTVTGLFRPRGIRWNQVVVEMAQIGSRAFGVVGLISFLVGATMALQSAIQLRQFGANIFVVDLIGISMTRELGPLMAAIVVAGRSGSAVAAELATMVITEEVDAVKTMGLNPTRFLVVPKVVAITLTQPMLTMMANVLGIFGGFLVAITYLDVGPSAFMNRLVQALYLKDMLTGLIKSIIFAQLIVTIGALLGLRTRGGADEVGRSTTVSVVASIFAVIVADAGASLLFYFGE